MLFEAQVHHLKYIDGILKNQFSGLDILSTVMFVFNLVLFTIFTLILVAKIFCFPKRMIKDLTTNLVELSMTGTVPIAWFTLVAQVHQPNSALAHSHR